MFIGQGVFLLSSSGRSEMLMAAKVPTFAPDGLRNRLIEAAEKTEESWV